MSELSRRRQSIDVPHKFFSAITLENIVRFTPKDQWEIQLEHNILKMLHFPKLDWLTTAAITGRETVIMKTVNRTHFYIHCDCLTYYYINSNVSNLLKTVPNTAPVDEKVVQSFSVPHYYRVSSRPLTSINMYITDGLYESILTFNNKVIYTLHFRQCPPPHF